MFQKIPLKANVPGQAHINCRTLVIVDLGAASALDLTLTFQDFPTENFPSVKRNFRVLAENRINGLELLSTVDTTVTVFCSNQRIEANYLDGSQVGISGLVSVSNDRGTPASPMVVSGVIDAAATAGSNNAPVAVGGAGAAALIAADATRKAVRFTNLGTDPVALGFSGLTWANRTIVLQPGDVWMEDKAGNLAWYGITDAGKSASVTAQGINV